jgi:hypothetical protein
MVWVASAENWMFSDSIVMVKEAGDMVLLMVVDSETSFLAVIFGFIDAFVIHYFKETPCQFLCTPLLSLCFNKL